jgi:hypothetical protein
MGVRRQQSHCELDPAQVRTKSGKEREDRTEEPENLPSDRQRRSRCWEVPRETRVGQNMTISKTDGRHPFVSSPRPPESMHSTFCTSLCYHQNCKGATAASGSCPASMLSFDARRSATSESRKESSRRSQQNESPWIDCGLCFTDILKLVQNPSGEDT